MASPVSDQCDDKPNPHSARLAYPTHNSQTFLRNPTFWWGSRKEEQEQRHRVEIDRPRQSPYTKDIFLPLPRPLQSSQAFSTLPSSSLSHHSTGYLEPKYSCSMSRELQHPSVRNIIFDKGAAGDFIYDEQKLLQVDLHHGIYPNNLQNHQGPMHRMTSDLPRDLSPAVLPSHRHAEWYRPAFQSVGPSEAAVVRDDVLYDSNHSIRSGRNTFPTGVRTSIRANGVNDHPHRIYPIHPNSEAEVGVHLKSRGLPNYRSIYRHELEDRRHPEHGGFQNGQSEQQHYLYPVHESDATELFPGNMARRSLHQPTLHATESFSYADNTIHVPHQYHSLDHWHSSNYTGFQEYKQEEQTSFAGFCLDANETPRYSVLDAGQSSDATFMSQSKNNAADLVTSSTIPRNKKASCASKKIKTKSQRNKCIVEGCLSDARYMDKCKRHGGSLTCSYPGCPRQTQSRGLCISHGGGSRCSVLGCDRSAQTKGLCKTHFGGGRLCQEPACRKKAYTRGLCREHGGGSRCSVEGCVRWSLMKGYCMTHFQVQGLESAMNTIESNSKKDSHREN